MVNKIIKVIGYILFFIAIWAIFSIIYILIHDNFRQDENKDLYCKITYGKDFGYPSTAHSDVRICIKESGNKILEGYYFTKKEQEKYCKEKFLKLNDCEEFK